MEYWVLKFQKSETLERYVKRALLDGWCLQGGVSVYVRGGSIYYAQAMVKEN